MLNRNRVWVGLVVGVLVPALAFAILHQIFALLELKGMASQRGFSPMFRERTVAIVALASNLWLMNIYKKRRWEDAMRGVVIATALMAGAWIWYFGSIIFR